jgi:hypothetical protein
MVEQAYAEVCSRGTTEQGNLCWIGWPTWVSLVEELGEVQVTVRAQATKEARACYYIRHRIVLVLLGARLRIGSDLGRAAHANFRTSRHDSSFSPPPRIAK